MGLGRFVFFSSVLVYPCLSVSRLSHLLLCSLFSFSLPLCSLFLHPCLSLFVSLSSVSLVALLCIFFLSSALDMLVCFLYLSVCPLSFSFVASLSCISSDLSSRPFLLSLVCILPLLISLSLFVVLPLFVSPPSAAISYSLPLSITSWRVQVDP